MGEGTAYRMGEVLRVAVDAPVDGVFDYVLPVDWVGDVAWFAGRRVRVPFGHGERVGVVVERGTHEPTELKPIVAFLDDAPLLGGDDLRLGAWLAAYYHAPLGEVLALMLPAGVRAGAALPSLELQGWMIVKDAPHEVPAAPRQTQVLQMLHAVPYGLADASLRGFSAVLRALERRGWVRRGVLMQDAGGRRDLALPVACVPPGLALNVQQAAAHEAIASALGAFTAFLLHGVTGSGKTEVYLAAMEAALRRGEQVLVLAPEIALTPQLVARFTVAYPFGKYIGRPLPIKSSTMKISISLPILR